MSPPTRRNAPPEARSDGAQGTGGAPQTMPRAEPPRPSAWLVEELCLPGHHSTGIALRAIVRAYGQRHDWGVLARAVGVSRADLVAAIAAGRPAEPLVRAGLVLLLERGRITTTSTAAEVGHTAWLAAPYDWSYGW